ncbi:hypothetical protein TD95_004805 [Thielaviopsis punctulata]|uniref:Acid phosphatase-like protein n=1 Tax=Thielaviopsis punctulata TaxID=72032 RepID=A0A0F4ZHD6_9PEZI|nr:hypothetical protein TD95_004805 [Thielaviopsis punctulata]
MVSGVGGFFITVLIVAFLGALAWFAYSQIRARKLGLPPPSLSSYNPFKSQNLDPYAPSSGGVGGWFKERIGAFKNRHSRSAAGAYEGARHDDEAWDTRADTYGYEAELDDSRFHQDTSYTTQHPHSGSSYNMNVASTPAGGASRADLAVADADESSRGRSRSREPDARANPFDDEAQPSNMSTHSVGPYGHPVQGQPERSATSPERRSIFREEV